MPTPKPTRPHHIAGYEPPNSAWRRRELARARAHQQGSTPLSVDGTAAAVRDLLTKIRSGEGNRIVDGPDINRLDPQGWVNAKIVVVAPMKTIRTAIASTTAEHPAGDLDARILRNQ